MEHRGTPLDTGGWYLFADRGDLVIRVHPGMPVGETASGELSFDPSCAQLSLEIGDDGDLVVKAMAGHELVSTRGKRSRKARVAHNSQAEIRLPRNLLQVGTGFLEPPSSNDTAAVYAVRRIQDRSDPGALGFPKGNPDGAAAPGNTTATRDAHGKTAAAGEAAAAKRRREGVMRFFNPASAPAPDTAPMDAAGAAVDDPVSDGNARREKVMRFLHPVSTPEPDTPPIEPGKPAAAPATAAKPVPPPIPPAGRDPEPRPLMPPDVLRHRITNRWSIAAFLCLAAIGIALLYPAFREDDAPSSPSNADSSAVSKSEPEQQPSAAPPERGRESGPSPPAADVVLQEMAEQTAEEPRIAASREAESASLQTALEEPPGQQPDPGLSAETKIRPAQMPPAERRPVPQVAGARASAPPAQPARPEVRSPQPREPVPQSSAQAEPAVDRQGTDESRQAVKTPPQELINRALAQIATNAFDDARTSLQAAADAGANPQLIADLRGEVDYRQWLINARAGRFDTLYPSSQLVALSQDLPSLPREGGSREEMSVEVQFTVTARGTVRDVVILDDPPRVLERAVERAMRRWRFEPVVYDGQPTPVRSSVRITVKP